VLVGLLVGALVLIVVEVVDGRTQHPEKIANPCRPRPPIAEGGLDGTIQQIVLGGLDRAACSLHTTREALVLSVGGVPTERSPHWTDKTITSAVRTGLTGSVDEAGRRGAVPGFAVPLLEKLVRAAPIEQLVRGGISLSDLIG
jgi:hypothetical protein